MPKSHALIFDEELQTWLEFEESVESLCAWNLAEVIPTLERVEAAAERGLTAIGYITYEAAAAFDSSLKTAAPQQALLRFELFEEGTPVELPATQESSLGLSAEMSKSHYLQQLQYIKQHLEAGDSYQVNFTHQLVGEASRLQLSAFEIFAQLYKRQPSPYAAYLQIGDQTVCSLSPELFFSLQDNHITMEPMKGTRPRGSSGDEDEAMRQELLTSEKERAENLMIVDMVRNDLGKIARPGSVHVDELFKLIPLPSLWQQVSRVSAQTDAPLVDILRAIFPCASITGAPKRQAMDIIEQLEAVPRGIYTGAIGVVRPQRRWRFSVAIRSLVIDEKNDKLSYGVGSGVVWDSDPVSEWQETLDKAKIVTLQSAPSFQLLETMAYHPGEGIFLLDYHLQRLAEAAKHFAYAIDGAEIRMQLDQFSAQQPKRLRLLLNHSGQFELQHTQLDATDKTVRLRLCNFAISSEDEFLQHKTTHRVVYEKAIAQNGNADDVILWNERGELTETCIYNLYLQIDGELLTPALESGLLAGTYRRSLIETGKAREAVLTKQDLERATSIYVSNSVRGLCPAQLIK